MVRGRGYFAIGWKDLKDGGLCSGRPSAVTYVEVKEQVDQGIRDHRRIGVDLIALEMSVSRGLDWHQCGLRSSRKHYFDRQTKPVDR